MQDGRVAKSKRPLLTTEQLGERFFKKLKLEETSPETEIKTEKEAEIAISKEESKDKPMALILYQQPAPPLLPQPQFSDHSY